MHCAVGMWIVSFFLLICFGGLFIGRMIGIEVQCLLLCKLNNQKSYTFSQQMGQQKKQSEKESKI